MLKWCPFRSTLTFHVNEKKRLDAGQCVWPRPGRQDVARYTYEAQVPCHLVTGKFVKQSRAPCELPQQRSDSQGTDNR